MEFKEQNHDVETGQLITIVLLVILFLVNLYVQSWELRLASAVILIVWLLIAILQIYYLFQARKRFSRQISKTQQILG